MNISRFSPCTLILFLSISLLNSPVNSAEPASAESEFKLTFWDAKDLHETYGQFRIKAMPAKMIGEAEGYPRMRFGCTSPRKEGGQWVYGWTWITEETSAFKKENPLRVIRCWTEDGVHFHDEQLVLLEDRHQWQGFVNLVRRETDNKIFLFPYGYNPVGSSMDFMVYSSSDGTNWKLEAEKAYSDHDACCVIWDPYHNRFINYQSTYQDWKKKYPDNIGGELRRVISIRYSQDGVHWTPEGDYAFRKPEKVKELWVPDEQDPDELEFYRICAFPYQGRYVGFLVLYAPSPQIGNTRVGTLHGPGLDSHLCYSLDGVEWNRPDRETNATPQSEWIPLQGPLQAGGYLRFYAGIENNQIRGLEETRIFGAYCRANGEFSTKEFTMPEKELSVNISSAAYDSYFMAEVVTPEGEADSRI